MMISDFEQNRRIFLPEILKSSDWFL